MSDLQSCRGYMSMYPCTNQGGCTCYQGGSSPSEEGEAMKRQTVDCDRCSKKDVTESLHFEIPVWDHVRACAEDTDNYDHASVDICRWCVFEIFPVLVVNEMCKVHPDLLFNRERLTRWKIKLPRNPRP